MPGFIDQVEIDFIRNGVGEGGLAKDVASGRFSVEPQVGFEPGLLRPVIQTDGQKYCVVKTGRMVTNKEGDPSYNPNEPNGARVVEKQHIPLQTFINNGMVPFTYNTSALTYQAWQKIDLAVLSATRNRLNAWNDLAAANTYGGFDGMAVTGLIKDTVTDAGEAKVDMDTLSDDFGDAPLLTPDILPLPIIHAGTALSQRRLAISRNTGVPLDTTMIEQCGRRCAETLEKMTIGETDFSGLVIGDDTTFTNNGIYGFKTHPDRMTKTDITTAASFIPATFVSEIIGMREVARAQNFFGPFVLYYSVGWDQYMAHDYVVGTLAQGYTTVNKTVLQRTEMIPGIQRVAMLDNMSNTDSKETLLLVQMTSDTVRAVVGMEFTTVQWQKDGGAQTMLRVMGIKVPDLRSSYVGTDTTVTNRVCGVVHGTIS